MAVGMRAVTSDGDRTLWDFEAAMRGALADAAEASGPVEDVRAAAEAGMATAWVYRKSTVWSLALRRW